MEQNEERLKKILQRTVLLINKSERIREDINHFSRTTFGFQSIDDTKIATIEPKCIANDILTNLAVIGNILDFVNDTVFGLKNELENNPVSTSPQDEDKILDFATTNNYR